jgi:hypothetical protein
MARSTRAPAFARTRSMVATGVTKSAAIGVVKSVANGVAIAVTASLVVLGSSGCDKIKAMAGGGDAGASAQGGEGGGGAAGDTLALLDGFEGEIDVSGKGDKPAEAPMSLALFVKAGKIRVDIPEELSKSGAGPLGANAKGYGIFDSAAKKIYVVLDTSKQVIVIDLDKVGEQMKGFSPPAPPHEHGNATPKEAPPKVTKTGKFDTVAGYKCENWDIASDHRQGTACVAEEGFSWLSFPMSALNGVPTEHLWMADLLDGKHFPLRFVGYGPDGVKETARIEVTKVEKKTLPATEFDLPAGYAQIDLDQMLRGFAGMGAMGGMPPHPPHPHN